jgi:hypothetical protein
MKKQNDSDLEITKKNGKYEFAINPPKCMIDAMKIFLEDEELQKTDRFSLTEDAWFGFFRTMPKDLWKKIANGQPIPLDRRQIFCTSGNFYIQDAKELGFS